MYTMTFRSYSNTVYILKNNKLKNKLIENVTYLNIGNLITT